MKMVRDLRKSPALVSVEQMEELESAITADGPGVTRRCAVSLLTRRGEELPNKVADDREFAVGCASLHHCLDGYVGSVKNLLELLKLVQARLIVALATREDLSELLVEGRAMTAPDVPGILCLAGTETRQ